MTLEGGGNYSEPFCWMGEGKAPVCFAHLGKFGDLMILLPAFREIARHLGDPPVCLVSDQFASLLEGTSYVESWPVPLHWYRGVGEAATLGQRRYHHCIVPKWWDIPGVTEPFKLGGQPALTLQVHGRQVQLPRNAWQSYQASEWRYAGFTAQQMVQWPLVFDRRDLDRESQLRRRYASGMKPLVLVNLSRSGTSPVSFNSQLWPMIRNSGAQVVDLSEVRAHRIYDLLGLYDAADLLLTSDTATLHLARASPVPYVAFLADGGAGSIPLGNVQLSVRYHEIMAHLGDIAGMIRQYTSGHDSRRSCP